MAHRRHPSTDFKTVHFYAADEWREFVRDQKYLQPRTVVRRSAPIGEDRLLDGGDLRIRGFESLCDHCTPLAAPLEV
jgi:hypothetical protein